MPRCGCGPAIGRETLDDEPGEASLDDSTSEDDPPDAGELELDETDSGWLGEPADAPDLELGDVAIADFGEETRGAEDERVEDGSDFLVKREYTKWPPWCLCCRFDRHQEDITRAKLLQTKT